MIRSYSELVKLVTYGDRLKYLSLVDHFYVPPSPAITQPFYKSTTWLNTRDTIIARDFGFDLGVDGVGITGIILVHHMNPLEEKDFLLWSDRLLDPDGLITTSLDTHNTIHYRKVVEDYVERTKGDTDLWR